MSADANSERRILAPGPGRATRHGLRSPQPVRRASQPEARVRHRALKPPRRIRASPNHAAVGVAAVTRPRPAVAKLNAHAISIAACGRALLANLGILRADRALLALQGQQLGQLIRDGCRLRCVAEPIVHGEPHRRHKDKDPNQHTIAFRLSIQDGTVLLLLVSHWFLIPTPRWRAAYKALRGWPRDSVAAAPHTPLGAAFVTAGGVARIACALSLLRPNARVTAPGFSHTMLLVGGGLDHVLTPCGARVSH